MNLDELRKPFDPALISWRVGATSQDKKSGIALAYIDARDVMQRLDDVCGIENWQVKYSHANGKTIADIGIKIKDEWVWKASGAGDTQVEAEKGAISDALKRAAVVWGVGRYLYDVQNVWVDLVPYGRSYKIKNPNDSRLIGALEKAAKGIRPIEEVEAEQETVTPEQWLASTLANLDEYPHKPRSTLVNLAQGDRKKREDPLFKKLNDPQRLEYEEKVKEVENILKAKLKEKENA